MKKKGIVLLALVCLGSMTLGLTACKGKEGKNDPEWGTVYTFETAYAQAQELGYAGTLEEFIAAISGKNGLDGAKGDKGDKGDTGEKGEDGQDGLGVGSAYQLYREKFGYLGTEKEWLSALIHGELTGETPANHEHAFGEWKKTEDYHAKQCLCGKLEKDSHTFEEGECTACGVLYGTDGLEYTLLRENGEYVYAVTGAPITQVDVVIPSFYNGKRVTSIAKNAFARHEGSDLDLHSIKMHNGITRIGEEAFYECENLTEITIPDSVTSIGNSAFYCCENLTKITIPDSVTSIGNSAFSRFTNLTEITIPNSLTSIGEYAFSGCTKLAGFTVEEGNTHYQAIDGVLYTKDGATLIQYPFGKTATSLTIPDGVTSIGNSAFSHCSSLTSITIPDSVTSIGDGAFSGCSSLTSITIGNGVTSIGNSAFSHCSSLTSITIGNGVTSIGDGAFYNCSSLTSITIPDSVTSIGEFAFHGCWSLTNVTFENPNGWKAGDIEMSAGDLQNIATAATYLESTYLDRIWTRTDE